MYLIIDFIKEIRKARDVDHPLQMLVSNHLFSQSKWTKPRTNLKPGFRVDEWHNE